MAMKRAMLALADGRIFEGRSFGAEGETTGEVVFNTSMAGYQEVLTDPSYKGQIVTMTCPLIGNYGVNDEDIESPRPVVEGFIVKEACRFPSNWRSQKGIDQYLKENGIVGIEGIDTRALTVHIGNMAPSRGSYQRRILTVTAWQRRPGHCPVLSGGIWSSRLHAVSPISGMRGVGI